ncbi:hypothetical protein S7711_10234 [Stachybotrys chartarum IBT 7711]|uniref:Uncharacterized protein n=1 Tax=Stachybotrys chartarum (strain CBS 109288 / IBT 7711) TaxID=1280523 RepID=A0A084AF36_STACB|nr:hypothetical protein S7711_10234 [Stachybotrys chartarum IBT 7711]
MASTFEALFTSETLPESNSWIGDLPSSVPDMKQALALVLALGLGSVVCSRFLAGQKRANFPLINPAKGLELVDKDRRMHFVMHSEELLIEGRARSGGQPFNIMTDGGEVTVFPPGLVNDIRNEPGLSFRAFIAEDFHAKIPGFEPFAAATRADELTQAVVRKQLTKFLNKVTKPLSEEASFATELRFGTSLEWRTFVAYSETLDIIARISSRVFLGEEVCRNQDWLDIIKSYTITSFAAADNLRRYPKWMRNIVHWFQPGCKETRDQVARAKKIVGPVIEKRRLARKDAAANGLAAPRFDDALDWFEEESHGRPYDAAIIQLNLSVAAIHTTSDLMTETILKLAQTPELMGELRQEISSVLRADRWKKTALYNMKLLDSVIKETQRMRPIQTISMNRKATADVKLPSGQIIPKGARTVCCADLRLSPEVYEDPLKFDGHRFQKWRATEKDMNAHLVSTGPASLGFGHGLHACPGRFFAANEIKVALCHLIMKYDWKLAPDSPTEPLAYGFSLAPNPMAKVMVRRRAQIEMDIDNIE